MLLVPAATCRMQMSSLLAWRSPAFCPSEQRGRTIIITISSTFISAAADLHSIPAQALPQTSVFCFSWSPLPGA